VHRLILSISMAVFAVLGQARAEDWPRFRGPNGSGVAEADVLPAAWSPSDYAWRVELPGVGHSSPVVWGNRVFINAERDDGAVRIVQCHNATDGSVIWSKEFPAATHRKHKFNSFATSTPCVDERAIYVAWATPEALSLRAISHASELLWEVENLGTIKGGHGFGTSPIVYGELVVIARDTEGDSSLIALERESGERVWETPRPGGRLNYSTPCIRSGPHGDELVFVAWPIGVTGVNPADGSVLWERACFDTSTGERAIASPIVHGELVLATCAFVNSPKHFVALRPDADGNDAAEVYRVDNTTVPHIPSPLVYQDRVYTWSDQGIVTCYRVESGEKVWQQRVGGTFFGSPICAGGRLYCAESNGEMVVLATGDEFEILARNDLLEETRATPAVADGRMYIRTFSHLQCVGASPASE